MLARLLFGILVVTLAVTGPAFADPDPTVRPQRMGDLPDFGSATSVPSNSGYEITDDGFLIYQGDIVTKCAPLQRENFTDEEFYEEHVEICTEAGFPPQETLPETGGLPLPLAPIVLILIVTFLIRAVTPIGTLRGPMLRERT